MVDEAHIPTRCPLCGGSVEHGETTFAVDLQTGVVVVRYVPAYVCGQCGEIWLEDETASRLERTVRDARARKGQVEVLPYATV